ncbi:hypothetical protein SAMN04488107_2345 [Geodermatophilus saharensis]|uniref:Uncharacterized protein n=1 Tax=Geodermatophilus saharensis TaxID=1137994 RepID=A0A239E3F1_9ACTN|nr:hypothetical protein [Geodermatophilus saharensis]SNS38818.1 hypothetical protein SAMN04488107_2345 [Geodermatophilus saharensis]
MTNDSRAWLPAAVGTGGAVLGLVLGVLIAVAALDPTHSDEYRSLQDQMAAEQSGAAAAQEQTRSEAEAAQATASSAAASASRYAAEIAQREAAVGAREQAVTAVEQQVAATSIDEGTWTVGRDVEPGTYRTAEAVTGDCYWGIYRSGSNGDDIIENDIVSGGFPTVTLSEGQDFKNNGCGTFIKQ